jgi:small-conductance mechanosensitive channel
MKERIEQALNHYWKLVIEIIPLLLVAAVIFWIFLLIAAKTARGVKNKLQKSSDTLAPILIANTVRLFIMLLGLSFALNIMGLDGLAGGVLAGAGVSGIVVGFALKEIAENYLAGILLAFTRPFSVGHFIELGSFKGTVLSIDLYSTSIKSLDGNDIYIPNSLIFKSPLTNLSSDPTLRQELVIAVNYTGNLDALYSILIAAISKVPDVLKEKKPEVAFEEVTATTVKARLYYWIDQRFLSVGVVGLKNEILYAMQEALQANQLSFVQGITEVRIRNT